jgi:tRNA (cytosine38-C5)-methyltransferase
LRKDAGDARALSFLSLIEMLSLMLRPPTHLFIENVVGFEASTSYYYSKAKLY